MDEVTVVKPAMNDAEPLAKLPPNDQPIKPLNVLEAPKVRTNLHIYSILVSLCVKCFHVSPQRAQLS
jgi:hypothetical protein